MLGMTVRIIPPPALAPPPRHRYLCRFDAEARPMIDAAIKALQQMFSPPFRSVLIKSVLLALVMIALIGVGLYKGLTWLTASGSTYAEGALGASWHDPLAWIVWIISIAASLGIVFGGAVPDAGGDRVCRQLFRRRDRRAGRARVLPGRSGRQGVAGRALGDGRPQDRADLDRGLSLRPALHFLRGPRLVHSVLRQRVSSEPRIFRTRGRALSSGRGSQGLPQGQSDHGVHRRAC